MRDPFIPCVGAVLSADIAVPEHERVVAFYSSVLCTGETPRWDEKLMNNVGFPIIGVGKRVPEYEKLPLQWMPHIQVVDVAGSVERALALGGTELMHGKGKDGSSQWAVVRDPNEAAFGLIPISPAPPAPADEAEREARSSAGRIAWLDLTVPEAGRTRDFYREVVGWGVEEAPMTDGEESYSDYCMVDGDANVVAGVCHARGMNVGLPSVWLVYLPVGDLAQSLRLVESHGGTVIKSTRGDDGELASAVISDPVGAYLALAPA